MERDCGNRIFIEKRNRIYLVSVNEKFRAGKGEIMGSLEAVLAFLAENKSEFVKPNYQLSLPCEEIEQLGPEIFAYHQKMLERSRIMGRILAEIE